MINCANSECGKLFTPNNGNQVYCSSDCRNRGGYLKRRVPTPKTEHVCPECGTVFFAKADAEYCSMSCYQKAHHKRTYVSPVQPELICPVCNRSFIPKKLPAIYCSRECYYKSEARKTAIHNHNTQGGRRQRVLALYARVDEIKSGPCVDCKGVFDPVAMDFDHITDNKVKSISQLINSLKPWEEIQAEIDKCELVCSNCHRVRSKQRGEFKKAL